VLERYEYVTPTMGTTLRCVVYAESIDEAQSWIDAGLSELELWVPQVNNYDPASEISRLNQSIGKTVQVSDGLWEAILEAKRWWQLSQGAFDVTYGALFQLWRSARKNKQPPSQSAVRDALATTGWDKVTLKDQSVTITQPGVLLDLSGLATGFLIDKAVRKMTSVGAKSFLVDIGGDICLGAPPPENQDGWKISIAGLTKASSPLEQVQLSNCAITTSGDRNQVLEFQGRRFSHLMDPRNGEPMQFPQSASVIAKTTLDADAGATCMAILGTNISDDHFQSLPISRCIYLYTDPYASSPASENSPSNIDTSRVSVRYRFFENP